MLTSALRRGTPYWLDHDAGAGRARPALRRNLEVDVVVVGGGVTGCTVACLLAQAGASVALLEGQRIARGSTAASTALLMQEPDADFTALAARYGSKATRLIWQAGRTAVDLGHCPDRDVGENSLDQ